MTTDDRLEPAGRTDPRIGGAAVGPTSAIGRSVAVDERPGEGNA